MIGIDSKTTSSTIKSISGAKPIARTSPGFLHGYRATVSIRAKSNERLTKATRSYADALIENVLTYDATVGKHHFNLVGYQTYEEENTDLLTGWGVNFTEPYFLQLQNAANTYAESF